MRGYVSYVNPHKDISLSLSSLSLSLSLSFSLFLSLSLSLSLSLGMRRCSLGPAFLKGDKHTDSFVKSVCLNIALFKRYIYITHKVSVYMEGGRHAYFPWK